MSYFKSLFLFLLLTLSLGCSNPLEKVTIVHIGDSDETGTHNQYTIVEFPDNTRFWNSKHWGTVGETFKARKSTLQRWEP